MPPPTGERATYSHNSGPSNGCCERCRSINAAVERKKQNQRFTGLEGSLLNKPVCWRKEEEKRRVFYAEGETSRSRAARDAPTTTRLAPISLSGKRYQGYSYSVDNIRSIWAICLSINSWDQSSLGTTFGMLKHQETGGPAWYVGLPRYSINCERRQSGEPEESQYMNSTLVKLDPAL